MRLDHLLSREPVATDPSWVWWSMTGPGAPFVRPGLALGGTSTTVPACGGGLGTLLGPEATPVTGGTFQVPGSCRRRTGSCVLGVSGGVVEGVGWLFENCTVDASIFCSLV